MGEVTTTSGTYRFGKLTPKQQLHIARRIAPLATSFKGGTDTEVASAFTQHIASMTDAEIDAIVDPCLAICHRKMAEGVWSPLVAPGTSTLMYEDLGVQDIFEIVIAVLKENLGNFFPGQGGSGTSASRFTVKT